MLFAPFLPRVRHAYTNEELNQLSGSGLSQFEAQAKRSRYTYKQILRNAGTAGKLWLSAIITINADKVQISTREETEEFTPLRVVWREIDEFTVSGLDQRSHLLRSILRFPSHDEADQAALAIKRIGGVEEESLPRQGEIRLKVRYLVPNVRKLLILILPILLVPLTLIVVVLVFPTIGFLPLVILFVPLFLARWLYLRSIGRRMKRLDQQIIRNPLEGRLTRPYEGWLRQEGETISIRLNYGRVKIIPEEISWKGSTTLVLASNQTQIHLEFPNPEDAAKAFQTIIENYRESRLPSL
jgi:hypothetical protein